MGHWGMARNEILKNIYLTFFILNVNREWIDSMGGILREVQSVIVMGKESLRELLRDLLATIILIL